MQNFSWQINYSGNELIYLSIYISMSTLHQRITAFNDPLLPDLVKLKYAAMAEGPFRFFRGTCHLFYEDLHAACFAAPSPITWTCGDLHIENYGSYKADNRLVYFDMNDFDEGILAPAAWELVRMVTSIFVSFDSLGIADQDALQAARHFLQKYAAMLSVGKAFGIDPRTARGIVCSFLTAVEQRKQKELLKKHTTHKRSKLLIAPEYKNVLSVNKALKKELAGHIDEWINTGKAASFEFKVTDVTFRLAGTGSIGVKRYLFLLKSQNTKNKYLLLDMKQARASSVAPYINIIQPEWENEATRVAGIQQRMQGMLVSLKGTTIFKDDAYTVQEMQPMEDKINFELIKDRYKDIDQVISDMALLTASAQLRSGGRHGSAIIDELIAFGNDTRWRQDVIDYARQYTRTVKKDYKTFLKDYKKGKY
jgi:uncharacterized protein (DUF2252 family)